MLGHYKAWNILLKCIQFGLNIEIQIFRRWCNFSLHTTKTLLLNLNTCEYVHKYKHSFQIGTKVDYAVNILVACQG